jgi:hypothetical protein
VETVPAGLSAPRVVPFPLTANLRRHHAVGAVQLIFGTSPHSSIVYAVFPSRADAIADFRAAPGSPGDVREAAPASLPRPSWLVDNPSVGISGVSYVDKNVLVLAAAEWAQAKDEAHTRAVRLARLADAHLSVIERG